MKKKGMIITSLAVGLCVMVSSAFADTAIGSGYKKLKQAGKNTIKYLACEASSYSTEVYFELKADGKTFSKNTSKSKVDIKNQKEYTESSFYESGEEDSHTVYSDSKMRVYSAPDEKQSVTYYENEVDDMYIAPPDPFEDKYAADIENVFDAFVGSLQDTVQCERNDQKNTYTCSLEPSQIPAYINALVSFGSKTTIDNMDIKEIENIKLADGVHIKSADAKAIEDENGLLTNIAALGVIEGKDKDGNTHEFSCEIYARIYDIDQTTVETPQIEADAEITHIDNDFNEAETLGINEASIGTYKRDILQRENGKLEKVGQRELVISDINFTDENKSISGHYKEQYTAGEKSGKTLEFDFEAKLDEERYGFYFEYQDDGKTKQGVIYDNGDIESIQLALDDYGVDLIRTVE